MENAVSDNGAVRQGKTGSRFARYEAPAAFLALFCLAVFVLGANPFSGQTVAPLDILMSSRAWALQTAQKTVHTESTDIVDSQLPTWISLKEQIRAGEGALWWPYGTGGQSAVPELTNPAFLLFLAVKDNAFAYYLVGLAKLVLAGFGCYLLLRAFLTWFPSLWGGMVFMLCGFNSAWFFWDQVTTALWIPWLLWAAVRYLKSEDARWLPAVTIASFFLILGGFPAVAAFGFYSFALLVILWNAHAAFYEESGTAPWTGRIRGRTGKTILPFAAVGIAFLLTAIALVPFADSLSKVNLSYRGGGTFGDGRVFGAGTNFKGIGDLARFLFPLNPSQIERTAYIGIAAFVLSLLGAWAAFRTKDRHLKRFAFITMLLILLSVSTAFGLLPHQLIASIPVFSSNNWGRSIIIVLLGLAVLSSIGLSFFLTEAPGVWERFLKMAPPGAYRLSLVLAIVIFAVQFFGQKSLFNRFNAVVPSAWMYPATPSITYVQERLGPLQSVIADASFNMSGTLGAFRIPQWHAHTFKTDREKEVLSTLVHDPFPSPTSAYVDGKNIQFDSPLMQKLAVKYVLVEKGFLDREVIIKLSEPADSQAPPLPDYTWKQHLSLPRDVTMGSLGFVFSTFGQDHAPANVRMALFRDGSERPVAESELSRNSIADNKAMVFRFPARVPLLKGGYTVVLSLADYTGPGKLSAWTATMRGDSGDYLLINGKRSASSLKYGMVAYEKGDMTGILKKWNALDLEKQILILENKQVTNSAYFIRTLDPANEQMDFSGLDAARPSSDLITIRSSQAGAGWVVLPVRLDPGWKAYVNDRPSGYDSYLGMLPAIPVNGPARIAFRYEPRPFKTGAIVSLSGVLVFALFTVFCLKYGGKRSPA